MEFRIAKASRLTGEMLSRLVNEWFKQNPKVKVPDCVVCYGAGYSGPLPALNGKCSRMSKMAQAQVLSKALGNEAIEVIESRPGNMPLILQKLPVLGRRAVHAKGRDIRLCRTKEGVKVAMAKGRDFFTPVVNSDTEYRVFVYRKRVLCVYEKRLTEPQNNKKFGRNRANGWTFHALNSDNIPEALRRVSIAAVAALSLDFGAVDVLGKWIDKEHTDIHATVLEVNSAPGVSDEHRSGIVKLVNRVVKWMISDCPERKQD